MCYRAEGAGESVALTSAGLRSEPTPLVTTSVEVQGAWPLCLWVTVAELQGGKRFVRAVHTLETQWVFIWKPVLEVSPLPRGPRGSGHTLLMMLVVTSLSLKHP